MMKLPSIQHLYQGLLTVVKRFPVQFVFIIIATVCWTNYINLDRYGTGSMHNEYLQKILVKAILISNLGLTLTLALDLLAEKKAYKSGKKWLIRILAVLSCLALFFLLNPVDNFADQLRIALMAFAFHLFVAFSPFMDKGQINGFWQFNKVLFLRFLTAALYSIVLYGGLAIALVAVDGLFNVAMNWKTYMSVFAIIAAGFSPVFFLAGIPTNFEQLEVESSYPKGLKIFTQFVLIPLMTIYLAILLFYEIKIMVSWSLPKGLVSSLIIGYAVFGILSLLLIYPMKEQEGNSWIKLFSRFFYSMLIPLILLLLLAVWKRVEPYGITESRYILILIALWLTCITTYFLFSKRQNIKLIPISLAILTMLAVYGPQSASAVSKYSQIARLKKILYSKKLEDLNEKPSMVRYLISKHGLSTLQRFTSKNLSNIENAIDSKDDYQYIKDEMKVDSAFSILKISDKDISSSSIEYTFVNADNQFLTISGFDYLLDISSYENTEKVFNGIKIKINRTNNKDIMINLGDTAKLAINLPKIFEESVALAKAKKLKSTKDYNEFFIPANKLIFSKIVRNYQFTYVIGKIRGYKTGNSLQNSWFDIEAHLLIKKL
ncbi:uncharacterized protein DUF4153 [Pedobacter psychrotolerans]|uniref:Uncharacterized protein DUF4153 n=1 Tax=Pedobacter psychrotolerans TaxID=1843235 RepID=A0A4R2HFS4_9SPHI|nr:DUF4153 domain-containing protein [Pedobacter psychrotolerans]TCO27280.1 uncharacterized protein DUF4153 [Pedobacter psychrotolerans]GGE60368.1 hypothetical protein GCM10011413_28510 [Pedobacter psychrotolerans]